MPQANSTQTLWFVRGTTAESLSAATGRFRIGHSNASILRCFVAGQY